MTVRVYVPSTLRRLAAAVSADVVPAPNGIAFAVTPELIDAAPGSDQEELEYLAMSDAARASLRLLGGEEDSPPARVVVAADVADSRVRVRDDLDRAAVQLDGPVSWRVVAAVHVDGADASAAVRSAVGAVDAADLGDLDAEFLVGAAEDHHLAWYAPGEIRYLLEELGLD